MRCLCSIMHPHASAHVHISHGGEDGDSMHSRGGSITHAEQCTSSDTERGGAPDSMQHDGAKMETDERKYSIR